MIRLKYLGKTVKGYLRLYQDVPPECEEDCPDCHGKLYKHGRYYRSVVTGKNLMRIPVYRRLCSACGKTFSLLPDFLFPYRVPSGRMLQRAWDLRYVKGKSYNYIQTFFSERMIGGISYKTITRWDTFWKDKKDSLIQLLISHIVAIHPVAFNFKDIKLLSGERALLNLLPIAWKILHPSIPYPFCGFLQWINQLIHKY